MDQMESMYTENTKSLNNILLKHDEMLLAYTSDHKRVNEKINVECEEFVENYKQKCVQLEVESKLLQQREVKLKKTENELKKTECKIMNDRSRLELKKRALLSCPKQLGNECHPYKKESEDLKRELEKLHARTTELEEQLKVKNEKLQIARMELETALQVSEDWEGVDLEEKKNNLQSKLIETEAKLQEMKKYNLWRQVIEDELEDARRELIDEMKTISKRANISVKTLEPGNEKCPPVQQLWNKTEDGEARLKECIEFMMKKWKTGRKQRTD